MDVWTWISTTTSVDSILTTLGLGALAFLFARDLILTRGAHLRRVQDLVAFHERMQEEKDARIVDYKETISNLQEVVQVETDRANKATEAVGAVVEILREMRHILESLDKALPRGEG